MLSLDDARSALREAVRPLPPRPVALEDALGCRLAAPVRSDAPLPLCDVSAMDGYAVRRDDLLGGAALPVTAEIAPGSDVLTLAPGAAARIFTGAALPARADTVVPQELAEPGSSPGTVRLPPLPAGSHVRRAGELFPAGAPIGAPGEIATPQRLALLAAGGAARVVIVPRPRAAVVLTGNELIDVSATPHPGQLRDTNGPLLRSLLRQAGLDCASAYRAADCLDDLAGALSGALRDADLVVTSGGVSVGDFDLVPRAIERVGGSVVLHGVAIKPGKPVLVARVGAAWLVGLPGNPLACEVGWRLFARPLAEALAGDVRAFDERPVRLPTVEAVAHERGRTLLRPARVEQDAHGRLAVAVVPWRGSHDLLAGARANALLRLEPGDAFAPGEEVPVYPLRGWPFMGE